MRIPKIAAALTLSAATITLGQTSTVTTQQYTQTNLVADSAATAKAATLDPNLQGGWGLVESATGPWWLSDNNNGLSTLYTGAGATLGLVVAIPPADPSKNKTGTPTGIVFNGSTTDFLLADGKPASFIYATLDGLIAGWNGGVSNNTAEIAANQSATSSFFGLTLAQAKVKGVTGTYLYATDFKARTIDVFDSKFNRVPELENAIASIPLPAGYAPYGIQNIGGNIYITLAKQNKQGTDQVNGRGFGLVGAITPEGKLLGTLETGNFLNAPWGVALAPADFGQYSHDLLVSNNGSGVIDVFNPVSGKFIARLRDASNAVIKVDGIWGIAFGSGSTSGGPATSLFFAAQPAAGGGLFGAITPVQNTFGSDN